MRGLSSQRKPRIHVADTSRSIKRCSAQIPMEIQVWSNKVASCIGEEFRTAKTARKRKAGCLALPIVKIAMKLLKKSAFAAVPTDKNGGFAIMKSSEEVASHITLLEAKKHAKPTYVQIACSNDDKKTYIANAKQRISTLAKEVAVVENDQGLKRAIEALAHYKHARFWSSLTVNCKTHKPPGEVSFRGIHSTPGYAWAGLAQYVAQELRDQLQRQAHLVNDSAFMKEKVKVLPCTPNHFWVKLDIEEYYMSGEPSELCNDAGNIIRGNKAAFVKRILFELLNEQYVESKATPGKMWKVAKGSGMGLKHSGETADAALFTRVMEWATREETCKTFGIDGIFQFRDDILMLCNDSEAFEEFFAQLSKHAGYFTISFDEKSFESIDWLDITIFRHNSRWLIKPFFKKSNIGVPLSCPSAHNPAVHLSWPGQVIRRLGDRSSTPMLALEAKQAYIDQCLGNIADERTVEVLESSDPWTRWAPKSWVKKKERRRVFLPLPFFPGVARSIEAEVQKCQSNEDLIRLHKMASEGEEMPQICIAWYNKWKPLMHTMRKLSAEKITEEVSRRTAGDGGMEFVAADLAVKPPDVFRSF